MVELYLTYLILIGASLVAAFSYGLFLVTREPSPARAAVKTMGVGFLLLAVAFGVWASPDYALLYLALGASALGDWLLAGPGERRFIAGVGAFAVAHGAYIPLFMTMGAWNQTPDAVRLAGMALLVVVASILLFKVLWSRLGALRWPLTGYFVIILGMGVTALALPPAAGTLVILVGAGLFILSDMVLGVELFRLDPASPARKLTSRLIWFTYYGGQVLIAAGTVMVLNFRP
jgi:uncharacterized membrane protein YhhN